MNSQRLSPALGVEIVGFDAREPSDDDFGQIHEYLVEGAGVLVLRDQTLEPEQHIAFSRRFGDLFGEAEPLQNTVTRYLHPDHPQIFRVSNKNADGQPLGRSRAGNYWHSDVSFRLRPASVSLLYAIELPRIGGDTLFCSTTLAYDSLSKEMRFFLDRLEARHDFAINTQVGFSHEQIETDDLAGQNAAIHPVVRRHPDSGRKGLFVNPGNTSHILGLHEGESRMLLAFLYKRCTQPEFIYRHSWRPHDLVIWDNRCTMHYAIVDYDADRYLHRTTVIGERPIPAISTD
ncbi:MAG: taurine dioxygenase [Gemmatimonadetes bacterium]|nr:taurine dioxygenase [Gemmatimonadota bacterium]